MLKALWLEFCAAFAAELGAGFVFLTAVGTDGLAAYGCTAFAAEFCALLDHCAAVGAFEQAQGLTAVVAEFALAGGLAAVRAEGGAFLELAVPYGCGLGLFVDVAAHGFVAGFRHVAAFARGAADAETFFFVPAIGTHPAVAGGAFREHGLDLGLGFVEGFFLLLAPLRASVFQAVAEGVRAGFDGVAEAAELAAQEVAEDAGSAADAFRALLAVIGGGLLEGGSEAVSAAIAVEFVLKTGFG